MSETADQPQVLHQLGAWTLFTMPLSFYLLFLLSLGAYLHFPGRTRLLVNAIASGLVGTLALVLVLWLVRRRPIRVVADEQGLTVVDWPRRVSHYPWSQVGPVFSPSPEPERHARLSTDGDDESCWVALGSDRMICPNGAGRPVSEVRAALTERARQTDPTGAGKAADAFRAACVDGDREFLLFAGSDLLAGCQTTTFGLCAAGALLVALEQWSSDRPRAIGWLAAGLCGLIAVMVYLVARRRYLRHAARTRLRFSQNGLTVLQPDGTAEPTLRWSELTSVRRSGDSGHYLVFGTQAFWLTARQFRTLRLRG